MGGGSAPQKNCAVRGNDRPERGLLTKNSRARADAAVSRGHGKACGRAAGRPGSGSPRNRRRAECQSGRESKRASPTPNAGPRRDVVTGYRAALPGNAHKKRRRTRSSNRSARGIGKCQTFDRRSDRAVPGLIKRLNGRPTSPVRLVRFSTPDQRPREDFDRRQSGGRIVNIL